VSYYSLSGAVTVDLSLSTAQNTGSGGTDTLLTMQHLDGSNAGADRLTGNGGDNRINGYSGADTLNGGTGNDAWPAAKTMTASWPMQAMTASMVAMARTPPATTPSPATSSST